MTVAFLVSAHVKNDLHEQLLRNCLLSIVRFHPDSPVVVCSDNSDDDRVVKYADLYTKKVENPFPSSGEFGSIYTAAHFPVPDVQHIVYMHDSTVMRRTLLPDELREEYIPLWNTDDEAVNVDACEHLITTVIAPQMRSTSTYTAWINALHSPQRTVFFGCMGIGTPNAYNRIWETGIECVASHMKTRLSRCRFERLLCCAAIVSGLLPKQKNKKPIQALYGNILRYKNAFTPCNIRNIIRWNFLEAPSSAPAIAKMWVGR